MLLQTKNSRQPFEAEPHVHQTLWPPRQMMLLLLLHGQFLLPLPPKRIDTPPHTQRNENISPPKVRHDSPYCRSCQCVAAAAVSPAFHTRLISTPPNRKRALFIGVWNKAYHHAMLCYALLCYVYKQVSILVWARASGCKAVLRVTKYALV